MMTLAGISSVFANTLAKNDWSIGYFIPTLVAIAITAIADPMDWIPRVRHWYFLQFRILQTYLASVPAAIVDAALHSSASISL